MKLLPGPFVNSVERVVELAALLVVCGGVLWFGGVFPWVNAAKMAELGLFGIPWPEEFGGAGMDLMASVVVSEDLARVDASHSITVGAHTSLCGTQIYRWGTEAQKEKYLTPLASGQVIGGFGLTEPGSGSDASGMLTTAVREGDHYVLNGQKTWITHGGVGEVFVVAAVTSPGEGNRGVSAFIMTKDTCDLERAREVGFGHSGDLEPMPGFAVVCNQPLVGADAGVLFLLFPLLCHQPVSFSSIT